MFSSSQRKHDSAPAREGCGGPPRERTASLALPVLPASSSESAPRAVIARSRATGWRFAVLALVQAAIVAHVIHWVVAGRTVTPVEPSESIQTVARGVVNAGAIFFGLTLLSTAVLGRWFCGWGCHVLLLQDGCAWLMGRLGIRPKPFRSRWLVYAPMLLALYMFIWPAIARLLISPGPEWHGLRAEMTTEDFWATFPSVSVAVPFLLLCGFVTVYFLGAKGFCTYGCPYGGLFAPLDRLAPLRVRVTDACEGCGHCTAVCTSNVRVHEEVRDYGMVVDPGCMKCLDCVSVCPKDALYYGFGAPALAATPRVSKSVARRYDLTWREEASLAAVFLAVFLVARGLYDVVPLLMAMGLAGCAAFIFWKSWRLMRDADVRFHHFQLLRGGRLSWSGRIWRVGATTLALLLVHSSVVQYHRWQGARAFRRVESFVLARQGVTMPRWLGLDASNPTASEADEAAAYGIAHLRKADTIARGGLALLPTPSVLLDLAQLHLYREEFDAAEETQRRAIAWQGETDSACADLARIMLCRRSTVEVVEHLDAVLVRHERFEESRALRDSLTTPIDRESPDR